MTDPRHPQDPLDELVELKRSEPAPELRWSHVDAKLSARIAREVQQSRAEMPGRHSLTRWAVSLAAVAAAAGALWFGTGRGASVRLGSPSTPAAEAALSLPSELGSLLEAGPAARSFVARGLAEVTLTAGTRARVVGLSPHYTLELLQGSVTAQVVPRSAPETFAVEVEQLRVAVHGTRFEVIRQPGSEVRLVVTEGRVVVGHRGRPGRTEGPLVSAPAVRLFDSSASDALLFPTPPNAQVATAIGLPLEAGKPAAIRSRQPATDGQARVADGNGSELAQTPSDVQRGVVQTQVVALAERCFSAEHAAEAELHISLTTTLSYVVSREGSLAELQFSPPLSGGVEACVRAGLQALHCEPSRVGVFETRLIRLGR